jgi:hypothetical protein
MTAREVEASLEEVLFPPEGVMSARKAIYLTVAGVDAPDPRAVVIRLDSRRRAG